jgi:hypothetical protein
MDFKPTHIVVVREYIEPFLKANLKPTFLFIRERSRSTWRHYVSFSRFVMLTLRFFCENFLDGSGHRMMHRMMMMMM